MAGNPVIPGEEEELDHIVDCTETVKVPIVKNYKVISSFLKLEILNFHILFHQTVQNRIDNLFLK